MLSLVLALAAPAGVRAGEEPRFAAPPGTETPEVRSLIDRAAAAIKEGRTPADLLTDPAFMQAHEWPRFRDLIGDHSTSSRTVIVTPAEPGEALVVSGSVRAAGGAPLKGAKIYVYQTSSKGWYSDKAPHVSGMEGDTRHARLFGYMIADDKGEFEFRTIHPAGYPGSNLPAHIHIHVTPADGSQRGLVSEIRFDDDPRMTEAMRQDSLRDGYLVCHVTRDAGAALRVRADFSVP